MPCKLISSAQHPVVTKSIQICVQVELAFCRVGPGRTVMQNALGIAGTLPGKTGLAFQNNYCPDTLRECKCCAASCKTSADDTSGLAVGICVRRSNTYMWLRRLHVTRQLQLGEQHVPFFGVTRQLGKTEAD